MDKKTEKVDRSRLTLLLGLSSTAAAGGCTTSQPARDRNKEPYRTFGSQKYPTDTNQTGGEGGGGGGGGGGSH
jgi:hypothetical protein